MELLDALLLLRQAQPIRHPDRGQAALHGGHGALGVEPGDALVAFALADQ